jgi:hypothetical protein
MNIPDYFTESLKAVFWFKILKIFDADPEAGIRNLFDPGSVMGLLPYVHKKNRHLPRPPPPRSHRESFLGWCAVPNQKRIHDPGSGMRKIGIEDL